jgi:hypothetical protein
MSRSYPVVYLFQVDQMCSYSNINIFNSLGNLCFRLVALVQAAKQLSVMASGAQQLRSVYQQLEKLSWVPLGPSTLIS